MGWEHDKETRWKAQELYCVDRLSFTRVAELTSVSATTLKAWSEKYNWRTIREEIAQAENEIRVNTIKSRKVALEMLLRAGDGKEASQMAFAVASLENLALKRAELEATGKLNIATTVNKPKLTTKADAVNALKIAVEEKIGLALADPAKINTTTIQDIKRCLDLMSELEATLPKSENSEEIKRKGLSSEIAESIYKALGVENE